MAKKKNDTAKKPVAGKPEEAVNQPAPTVAPVENTVSDFVPEERIPAAPEPTIQRGTPENRPRTLEDVPADQRVRTTDTSVEELVGFGDVETFDDVDLPIVNLSLDSAESDEGGGKYSVEKVVGAGDINFNWHPAIVRGRCESCGSTRYVGGTVWKVINKKTGDINYVRRGGRYVEIDAAHCKHYRQVRPIACSYCRNEFTGMKDRLGQFTELMGERNIYVCSLPGQPNKLIMHCDDFGCRHKFNEQYHINQTL